MFIISCRLVKSESGIVCCSLTTAHFLCSCQTFEGGIAGEPGSEAHGG